MNQGRYWSKVTTVQDTLYLEHHLWSGHWSKVGEYACVSGADAGRKIDEILARHPADLVRFNVRVHRSST